ncbi:chloride transporter, chloride channel (ClC) family protein [Klebsiella grimontii]|uniref:Chloride transporter, chloride channel (ClC) family protein n=1 Tax=Klebsiella grimontii TaxID=2058152 RepID=A0A7H4NUG8_9ENTR|nr:chloride transporter, chloride channel (ClC) family protein [Klebsiella grimontii]
MVVILAVLRGGAEGGLLTPGLAVGGMTSLLLCMLWQQLLPGGDCASFALVGAAAFLAASMQMPLTAVALVMEFHPHGSQLSGSHAAVRRRGVFNLPDTG